MEISHRVRDDFSDGENYLRLHGETIDESRNMDASEFHEPLMRRDHRCAMPTALRDGPYRFFFYAGDGGEPPHVHVRRDRYEAKFWIEPVQVAANLGFADQELNRIRRLVVEHAGTLMEAWHDYFSS